MKLSKRISAILLMIVFVNGLVICVLSAENGRRTFDEYLNGAYNAMLEEWGNKFAEYYVQNGNNWDGVDSLFVFNLESGVVLTDLDGVILYHYDEAYLGKKVPVTIAKRGYPLQLNGKIIGVLYPAALFNERFITMEQDFIQTFTNAIAKGTLVAGVFAAMIGLGLATSITAPLQDLMRATKRLAKGKPHEDLPVYSGDELGDLARAFNTMAHALERSSDLRKQMTADISHELRTPLTVLAGKLEFSLDQQRPLTQEETVILYDEVIRLRGLVNELQDMSKLDAGYLQLDRTFIDFKKFFEEFFILIYSEAEQRNMQLSIEVPDDLPAVYADGKRLKQIVLNLVNNAFRYTPDGGSITIRARKVGTEFEIEVQDTGEGISQEDLQYVFERFYRVDRSRDRETGGSGLGLAITKALVEAHNGKISVRSVLNEGSCFTVRLPDKNE